MVKKSADVALLIDLTFIILTTEVS